MHYLSNKRKSKLAQNNKQFPCTKKSIDAYKGQADTWQYQITWKKYSCYSLPFETRANRKERLLFQFEPGKLQISSP